MSPEAQDAGFCGAEQGDGFQTVCRGRAENTADQKLVEDARLTIVEDSGRRTEFEPFPSESLNGAVPHDVRRLGGWVGVTMTSEEGFDRQFLVHLDSLQIVAFPPDSSFGAASTDGTEALVTTAAGDRGGPQRIVRIPQP